MCVAVRIVIGAPTPERQMALRRAALGVEWEVVAAATDAAQAVALAERLHAQFVVLDAATDGAHATGLSEQLSSLQPPALLVGVGQISSAHASVPGDRLGDLRRALAGLLHEAGDHAH